MEAKAWKGPLGNLTPHEVQSVVDGYLGLHDAGVQRKTEHYRQLAHDYYDLVTDYYEWGWGDSFHFAPRRRGENLRASLLRYEHRLADELSLKPGMQVLDAGCGVGGPMGNLARYSGASIVGININAYQIEQAKAHTRDVEALCGFIHGDFMQVPVSDGEYDGATSREPIDQPTTRREYTSTTTARYRNPSQVGM